MQNETEFKHGIRIYAVYEGIYLLHYEWTYNDAIMYARKRLEEMASVWYKDKDQIEEKISEGLKNAYKIQEADLLDVINLMNDRIDKCGYDISSLESR